MGQPIQQNSLLIFLGRESELAFTELVYSLSGKTQATKFTQDIAIVEHFADKPKILQDKLGGCIKIAQVFQSYPKNTPQQKLIDHIAETIIGLSSHRRSKIPFAVSLVQKNQTLLPNLSQLVKKRLAEKNVLGRFIPAKHTGLSSVQLSRQHVIENGAELFVIPGDDAIYLAKTVTFQNYRLWSKRDYGRPKADPRRGMLPPKLARMLVNIGLGLLSSAGEKTVLDPFCGEGTILQEALTQGCVVYGSDIDSKAIADTKDNLAWALANIFQNDPKIKHSIRQVVRADVRDLAQTFTKPITVIITEPYLGKPLRVTPSDHEIDKERRIISDNFKALLKQGAELQESGAVLGCVIPRIVTARFSQTLVDNSILDSCEKFGYTLACGPLQYARKDAVVQRLIYFFQKGKG